MASLTDHPSDPSRARTRCCCSRRPARFNRFEDGDTEIVVVAPDNDVDAEVFVELLPFDNVKDRIRFGIEGAMDAELVSEGDEVVCIAVRLRRRIGRGDPRHRR